MTECHGEIDCRSAVQQLWDYLDDELTPERMNDVRRHLEKCARCLPHHNYARAFLAALASARDGEARAPDVVRHRVIETLRAAGFTTG